MEREEFEALQIENEALINISKLLRKEYTKRREKITTAINKPFEIIYRDVSYANENEVQDAYGCGIITSSVRDHLIHRFQEHNKFSSLEVIQHETQILKSLVEMVTDKLYSNYEKMGDDDNGQERP